MPVDKTCIVCGKAFSVPPVRAESAKTCGNECAKKVRAEWQAAHRKRVTKTCKQCGKAFEVPECHASRRHYCSRKCMWESTEHREKMAKAKTKPLEVRRTRIVVSAGGKRYLRVDPALENANYAKRRAAKRNATPAWACHKTIKAIYRQARQVSRATGVVHHVDHIVPLTSDVVCGLHVEHNLRVIPGADNLSKSNKLRSEQ